MKRIILPCFIMMLCVYSCRNVKLKKLEIQNKGLTANINLNQSKFPNKILIEPESSKKNKLLEVISATGTIFIAGFGDKSFLITTVMATKYSKSAVFLSAITSLTLMGYISVQMGLNLPHYIPTYWIDIFAV